MCINQNNFKYDDVVYYVDLTGTIHKALFSEYWHYGMSYIRENSDCFQVETKNLFDSEKNLLLFLLKDKRKSISCSEKLIEKLKNELPILNQELLEIINKIERLEDENRNNS